MVIVLEGQFLDTGYRQLASSNEASLVKSLHPIREIAANGAFNNGRYVRLTRDAEAVAIQMQAVDLTSATRQALAEPLDYPPLAASIVPGDRVAIAVDEAVPEVGEIVLGVVQAFRAGGIDDDAISVVTRDSATSRQCQDSLSQQGESAVQFVVHDPDDQRELCLVGMTKRHGPLVVNRAIFDADVILPVGCTRLGGRGVYDSLYPRFSNTETIERFRSPSQLDSATAIAALIRETDEAGWLIGAPLVVEVIPAADEKVAQVIAGEPHAVYARAQQLCREQWAFTCAQRASLVIATVTGGSQAQTWNNIGRALVAAERVVAEDGAVAICCNLDQPPGESLGRLIGTSDLASTERRLLRDHADDSWTAWLLARALQRGPVYFLSQLDAETVEDMGLAPMADIAELSRLASHHDTVIVLPDSQHAIATVEGEEA
jgi:nickel-dependent lactate racemase